MVYLFIYLFIDINAFVGSSTVYNLIIQGYEHTKLNNENIITQINLNNSIR